VTAVILLAALAWLTADTVKRVRARRKNIRTRETT
jgi:hypothetical protein